MAIIKGEEKAIETRRKGKKREAKRDKGQSVLFSLDVVGEKERRGEKRRKKMEKGKRKTKRGETKPGDDSQVIYSGYT